MAPYLREFATNWRPLSAAFIGMASGYTINNYLNNLFIPALISEFHWRSDSVALLSGAATLSIVCQPLAGRLTDRFGVRPVALCGVMAGSGIFLAFSLMTGTFWIYAILVTAQIVLVASTTAAVVYSRPVAQAFRRARGLALALVICAPSLAGAFVISPLATFIEAHGWRSGYRLAAATSLVLGLAAVILSDRFATNETSRATVPASTDKAAFGLLFANGNFRMIVAGMALCSLSITFQTTQLKVALLQAGVAGHEASTLIGVYALGVIVGRLASGIALDVLPTRWVAALAMALPALGLFILASAEQNPSLLYLAMLSIGFSLGAEGDIAGYLVISYLPSRIYSTACGIVIGSISFAAGIGALLLGATLASTQSFAPFLWLCGAATLLGSVLFSQLKVDKVSVSHTL